ncbi:hypothetical protein PENTCL1PPCAC_11664 [Pristionchus entomophagus]|uniref:Snake toxin/toxin-like domain-containing protein n=1 Tax=Pristionchus entomophagus TaxID=358040 RepID=A0AAV5T737_9BILA|nr:hypothetical protein PENTCL1PPCAC_11664 [Pristionchus entomophagus]
MIYLQIVLLSIATVFSRVAVALRCYSCSFSFNELYDMEHRDAWCANESLVLYDVEETSKSCAPWEAFCVTAVMTINNAFTSVSRGCGERCSELCESEGYGQDQVNCDDCCEDDLCNANFSVQYYITMMESQYTSWTKPLSGEQDWNNKSGLRFPS